MSDVPLYADYIYLGYDEHGMTHVPCETTTLYDETTCRPLFGLDEPLNVLVRCVPADTPVTCLECLTRRLTHVKKRNDAKEDE